MSQPFDASSTTRTPVLGLALALSLGVASAFVFIAGGLLAARG